MQIIEQPLDREPGLHHLFGGLQRLVPAHCPLVVSSDPRQAVPQRPTDRHHAVDLGRERGADVIDDPRRGGARTLLRRFAGEGVQGERCTSSRVSLNRLRLREQLARPALQLPGLQRDHRIGQPEPARVQRIERGDLGSLGQDLSLTGQLLGRGKGSAVRDQHVACLAERRTRPAEFA